MEKLKRRMLQEKRSDEESLYYIIERDLARDAIFPYHDGWYPQVRTKNHGIIDYVIKYGDKLIGIEVKKGFPDLRHFKQASKYSEILDAVFLAYPSDGAGEAIFLSESKHKYLEIGLLSIALFRTHVIRKARTIKRKTDEIWREYLDEKGYWANVRSVKNLNKDERLVATALKEGCIWMSVDKDGNAGNTCRYSVELSAWRSLAILYALSKATSIHKLHTWKILRDLFFKRMKWGYINFVTPLKAGLIYNTSYGNRLTLYNFTVETDVLNKVFRRTLKEKLGSRDWNRILTLSKTLKAEHIENQNKYQSDFLC